MEKHFFYLRMRMSTKTRLSCHSQFLILTFQLVKIKINKAPGRNQLSLKQGNVWKTDIEE